MNWKDRLDYIKKQSQRGELQTVIRLALRRLRINLVQIPLCFPLALVFIPLLYLLEPFLKVRISSLPTNRIGHLCWEPEIYLRRLQRGENPHAPAPLDKIFTFFVTSRAWNGAEICSQPLMDAFKRQMRATDSYLVSWLFYGMFWWISKTRFFFGLPHDEGTEVNQIFHETSTHIRLTPQEEAFGEAYLTKKGFDLEKDWLVCVFARDDKYLNTKFKGLDWSYHQWRNSKIESFVPAVEEILSRGGWVFRLGSHVANPLPVEHPRCVDYGLKDHHPLLDLFLISRCRFLMGSTSGICDLATTMGKPRLTVDLVPLGYVLMGKEAMYLPKHILRKSTGEFFPMQEALAQGKDRQFEGDVFLTEDLKVQDNHPEDILAATQEMFDLIQGKAFSPPDQARLEDYYRLFQPGNFSQGIKNPVSPAFLKKYPQQFFKA